MTDPLRIEIELTDEEDALLTDEDRASIASLAERAVQQIVAQKTFHPHVVKHEPTVTRDVDADGKRVKGPDGKPTFTTTDTVTDCPDCTRGLYSTSLAGEVVRACSRLTPLPPGLEQLKVTPHDVIACGYKDPD